ncbi:MAG: wax ester/triacylglycerol synthase family O-acyltransferase [Acidimicrobiales bacterium]
MRRLHRLGGNDDFFLLAEADGQPMHYLAIVVLSPEPGKGGAPAGVNISLEELTEYLSARIHLFPALRWRIKQVPLGLAHPVAFDDPDFDLSRHLDAVTLPAPGGPAQLDALVEARSEQPLDRSRPLWRITLANGLQDGHQAILFQVHHALMDGLAVTNLVSVLFGETPAASIGPAGAAGARPGREPGGFRLFLGGMAAGIRNNFRFPKLLWRSMRGGAKVKARQKTGAVTIPTPGPDTPACVINCPQGPGRRFARAYLPLADIKAIKDAAGTTVNDVALALCAGALRDYLEVRGQLPLKPLVGALPVAVDPADSRRHGNRWTGLSTTLATDIADPWQRLQRISEVTQESKIQLALMGVTLFEDWMNVLPPFVTASAVRKERRDAADPNHVRFNLSLSNLRGPAEPLALAVPSGRWQVTELFITAVPANRQGLSILCLDLADELTFGIFAMAESVPDPAELVSGLHRALGELVHSMQSRPPARVPAES